MLLGFRKYRIMGEDFHGIYKNMLKKNISAKDVYEKKEFLYITISEEFCKDFEKICLDNNCSYKIMQRKGLMTYLRRIKKRPGLAAGFIAVIFLLAYFSDVVIDIQIMCDDASAEKHIRQALKSEGITAGCYIPNINYAVAERNIRRKTDEISWVGITRKGSVLIIDTVNNIPKPESTEKRLPSNLYACEDAVIDKIEIKDGQLKYGIGCGVVKGDILVSGKVVTSKSEWIDGKEKITEKVNYTRSIGKIYGTFEKTITFTQKYKTSKEKDTGKEEKISRINFFSAEIPLYSKIPEGYFKTKSTTRPVTIFGIETPISITNSTLSEYEFENVTLDEDSACKILEEKFLRYEQNFLKDKKILDRKIKISKNEKEITQTVTYTLYGIISKESEFFINKFE